MKPKDSRRFPLIFALLLAAALGLAGCQDDQVEVTGGTGGLIDFSGTLASLDDTYAVVTLDRDEASGDVRFPAGSDLRFPIDESIQETLEEWDIQVGDRVAACFLDGTEEAGDPPTVQVMGFGLDEWELTGELLDYGDDFFLIKPLYPDWAVQEADEIDISRTGPRVGPDVDNPEVGMYLSFSCVRDLIPGDPVQVTAYRWNQVTDPYPDYE